MTAADTKGLFGFSKIGEVAADQRKMSDPTALVGQRDDVEFQPIFAAASGFIADDFADR